MSEQFVKLPTDILKRRDLFPSDKLLFAVVMDHQRDNGFCWPGILSLMSSTGLARQTVISAIQRLESAGLVDVIRRGNGKSNHYKTGPTIRPVQRLDRSNDCTTGGLKIRPEPVQPLDLKQIDELNQKRESDSDEAGFNREIFGALMRLRVNSRVREQLTKDMAAAGMTLDDLKNALANGAIAAGKGELERLDFERVKDMDTESRDAITAYMIGVIRTALANGATHIDINDREAAGVA